MVSQHSREAAHCQYVVSVMAGFPFVVFSFIENTVSPKVVRTIETFISPLGHVIKCAKPFFPSHASQTYKRCPFPPLRVSAVTVLSARAWCHLFIVPWGSRWTLSTEPHQLWLRFQVILSWQFSCVFPSALECALLSRLVSREWFYPISYEREDHGVLPTDIKMMKWVP